MTVLMRPRKRPAGRSASPLDDAQRAIVEWIRRTNEARGPLNISAVKRRAPEILEAAFGMRPFWGWRRAIEAAGLRYDRILPEFEEKVTCQECGLRRVSLTTHLWRQHQFEAGEYQELYPGAPVFAEAMLARRGLSPSPVAPHWEPIWTPEYLLDRVSYYLEIGIPVNRQSVVERDPALTGMASRLFSSWDEILEAIGLEPESIRLANPPSRLLREQVLEELRDLHAGSRPRNPTWVARHRSEIRTAAIKHFGTYRRALAAAGLDPKRIYKSVRHDADDERRLFARVQRVSGMVPGKRQRAALDRLHREHGFHVQQTYGGWRELARRLNLPPHTVMRGGGWDRDAVVEALWRRKRDGESLRAGDIHYQNKGLYLAVIRYFGTFEDCYELLGYPRPPVPIPYRREFRSSRALLERIRDESQPVPPREVLTGHDVTRFARLAWLARHHFGSWDEGLRRAGVRSLGYLDSLRYADPRTVDADLERLLAGRLRGGAARRRLLFRHAHLQNGSVVAALIAAGASREHAFAVKASASPEYPNGTAVLAAIERRRRDGLPVSFPSLKTGSLRDSALLEAGKLIFGTWEEALRTGGPEPHPKAES